MKVQYLGSAASEGWPALFCRCENCRKAREMGGKNIRTRSQTLINQRLLVDFPPDTYYHIIAYGHPFDCIDDIIITHSHSDHFYADDLFCRLEPFAVGVSNPLTVYGNDAVEARFHHARLENCGKEPVDKVRFRRIQAFETYSIAGHQVTPLPANHNKSEKCFIYLISDGQKTVLYGHDTGIFPEETWEAIKGNYLDLVSLDCTFMLIPEGSNHMGLPDNIKVAERLKAIGCADEKTVFVANHFSHSGGCLHAEMEKESEKAGFLVSYDGFTVDL